MPGSLKMPFTAFPAEEEYETHLNVLPDDHLIVASGSGINLIVFRQISP